MPIARTGSVGTFNSSLAEGSQSIVIPSDAEIIVISGAVYSGYAHGLHENPATFGGSTMGAVDADYTASYYQGMIWYLVIPEAWKGTSKDFVWDYFSYGNGGRYLYAFYKGIDTVNPVKDSDGVQNGDNPHETKSLSAQSGDMIVAAATMFYSESYPINDWAGATEVAGTEGADPSLDARSEWAEGSPSDSTVVSFYSATDGGIVAIVLKPAGGTTHPSTNPLPLFFRDGLL